MYRTTEGSSVQSQAQEPEPRNGMPSNGPVPDAGSPSGPTPQPLASESPDPLTVDPRTPEVELMTRWLRLFVGEGQVVELRALEVSTGSYRKPHTVAGYFDAQHLEAMAWHAYELTESAKGVYFTLNPLHRDLLARCYNRTEDAPIDAAADKDVLEYHWLLIDLDPQRISGISATEAEKAKACEKSQRIQNYLRQELWPDPILADSGNGYHLLYRVQLPLADTDLIQRVLHALGNLFDDDFVKVDRAVYNPSRIIKVYGTRARKGDHTPERPHRRTGILAVPETLRFVPRPQLEALASKAAPTAKPTTTSSSAGPTPDRGTVQERARDYLDRLSPAIAGNRGHDRTFHAACALVLGFRLSVDEALPLLQHYNQRCQPPWSEKELLHKLGDAEKKEGPRGYLLRNGGKKGEGTDGGCFQPDFLDSAALRATVRQPRWLVQHILVADQLAVIGGPKKALKTSLIVDLAISLGSASPFLGRFPVPQAVKVLLLSGESGQAAILDTADRVCRARGSTLDDCNVCWKFDLPSLTSESDLSVLSTMLVAESIAVVIIDPLYLCLLRGDSGGRQASSVYDVGPILHNVDRACKVAGATPILVHHARKTNQMLKGRAGDPLELDDLAFAGVGEYTRQWLLVSRREPFAPEKGEHKLWLNVGGSAGHAGLYGLEVYEGVMDSCFGGRKWQVTVERGSTAIQASKRAKEEEKRQQKAVKEADERAKVVAVLRAANKGMTVPDIVAATGLSRDKVGKILAELLRQLLAVKTRVLKCFGSGMTPQPGWLLWCAEGRHLTDEQREQLRSGMPIDEVLPTASRDGADAGSVSAGAGCP